MRVAPRADHLDALAANVRAAREQAQLSQVAVSIASGLDLSFLNEIENGKRDPSTFTLLRIARVVGSTPAALLDGIV